MRDGSDSLIANVPPGTTQLEFGIARPKETDRNFHLGGRSFYFFDFDDNVAFLGTELILFDKNTGRERIISSGEFAKEAKHIGLTGVFANYEINWDDKTGTFRNFRDHDDAELKRLQKKEQIFITDVALALGQPDFQWKGPSWTCFYHATFNQRPVSVITARGHHPETIRRGVEIIQRAGHLPMMPNFLSIYPVNNPEVRRQLGDIENKVSTAELKQAAIRASVEKALEVYGYSPHHRFGMSDDDPKNIELIADEMSRLKSRFPEMKFFIIETQHGEFNKREIGPVGSHRVTTHPVEQLPLVP